MEFLNRIYCALSLFLNQLMNPKKDRVIYFDFETTGLNPFQDKIIEYAFMDNQENGLFSLINPKTKFDKKITDITGIHPNELEDKPEIKEKIIDIESFLNNQNYNNYLIAHNCDGFDKWFFRNIIKNYSYLNYTEFKFIDTLILAKMLLPKKRSYSLSNLCKEYEIKFNAHRALDDTLALKKLYVELLYALSAKIKIPFIKLLSEPKFVYEFMYH